MKNMKKLLVFCLAIICCIFSFVGCNCNEEETEEEKYLRLYDLNQNAVVDDWEKPYNYDEYNGVEFSGRNYYDSEGKEIGMDSFYNISDTSKLNAIVDFRRNEDKVNRYPSTTLIFDNGTFFERTEEQINLCYGFRAYIVKIYSADELRRFAEINLKNPDSEKYILSLESDISFRTGESSGAPLDVFGKEEIINLNGAALYGNGKTIEGFKLLANNLYKFYDSSQADLTTTNKEYDSAIGDSHVVNLKYSLISNARAVYDLNIHMGYNNIVINPPKGVSTESYEMVIDVSPLRNVEAIDNINVRGKMDMSTLIVNEDYGQGNSNITPTKINVSFVTTDEDSSTASGVEVGEIFDEVDENNNSQPTNIYDYDRLIKTTVVEDIKTEEVEEGETPQEPIVTYTYTKNHTYSESISSKSITNCTVMMLFSYMEDKLSDTTYYDAPNILNIGGIVANAEDNFDNIKHCSVDIVELSVSTGANVQLGAITSDTSKSTFIENCKGSINLNLQVLGTSASTVGGIAGYVNSESEIKNATSSVNAKLIGYVEKDENGITKTRVSSVATGGIAGINNGLIDNSYALGNFDISEFRLVSSGAVAGASTNGLFIKDIASVSANMHSNDAVYSATVVGSIIGGFISHNWIEYTTNIKAIGNSEQNDTASLGDGKVLGSTYKITAGLLYNQSNAFNTVCSELKKESTETLSNIIAQGLKWDSFYYLNQGLKIGLVYAPKCYESIVIDNTFIDFSIEKLETDEDEEEEVEEEESTEEEEEGDSNPISNPIYVGKYINLGGYFTYRFDSSIKDYEVVNNLRVYNSSLKIDNGNSNPNDDNIISYYKSKSPVEEGEEKTEVVNLNFYSSTDTTSRLNTTFGYTYNYIKDVLGLTGFDKSGKQEIEIIGENVAVNDLIRNIKINNINVGPYLEPTNFQDIDMLDPEVYANLNIDTYEEFQNILDVYLYKDNQDSIYNTSLKRKDLFEILLFKASIFEKVDGVDDLYFKDYELVDDEDDTNNRFERDEYGNLVYKKELIYSNAEKGSIYFDHLVFGEDKKGKIFAFKKEILNTSVKEDNTIVYNLPEGFTIVDDYAKDNFNPMEMLIIYRLTQILGVEYVKIDKNPNSVAGITYTSSEKTMFTIYYANTDKTKNPEVYVLDTLCEYTGEYWDTSYNSLYMFYHIRTLNVSSTIAE